MSVTLTVQDLTLKYPSYTVLDGVEFTIEKGEMVALLGANGAGKSTLLRALTRSLPPAKGAVLLDGHDIRKMSQKEISRFMAVVPQDTAVDFDFTVEDVVLMGRFPYMGRFQKESRTDREIARQAMEMTGVSKLADRSAATLSGGERQRVIIARALCQEPELLLLDEPTANLDISYQSTLLELAVALNREKGITVVAAIHDLNLATQFFDRFLLLAQGCLLAAGSAEEVITPENIEASYGVQAAVFRHPLHGRLQVSVPSRRNISPTRAPGKEGPLPAVHVIGGGAEAIQALDALRETGARLSIGPVTAQDSSYQYARFFNLPVVEVFPFSPISGEAHQAHLDLIHGADIVVIPPIAFGPGNLPNLEAVLHTAARRDKTVYIMDPESTPTRDYSGGKAQALVQELQEAGAIAVKDKEELIQHITRRNRRDGSCGSPDPE